MINGNKIVCIVLDKRKEIEEFIKESCVESGIIAYASEAAHSNWMMMTTVSWVDILETEKFLRLENKGTSIWKSVYDECRNLIKRVKAT